MRIWIRVLLVATLVGTVSTVLSYSTGPPDGRTGAPDELTCQAGCHASFPLNSGDGLLNISSPATYTPGTTIPVIVHIEDPGQSRWGFEVTVLDQVNQPIGDLVVTDAARTQESVDGISGREYIKHTVTGTNQPGANPESDWSFEWIPPSINVGPVTFYAAGNAANGNGFNTGDYIYTTSVTVNPEVSGGCCQVRVGDANGQGGDEPTIGDVSVMIDAKFITGSCGGIVACLAEADVNQSGGVIPTCDDVTIGDISILIDYLFITGPSLGLSNCL